MFFDTILLQTQHKGHFGIAWLAATRGVNIILKDKLIEVDICKLCNHLLNYIISQSRSPKKRLSLRLSALLLSGASRIFKFQVLLLEGQVIAAIQIVHIPAGARGLPVLKPSSQSPLTPIIKKKERKAKKPVATPTSQLQHEIATLEFSEFVPLPEVEDILAVQPSSDLTTLRDDIPAVQPSSDLITLREEMPRQPVIVEEDNFGLPGDLTVAELREIGMDSLLSLIPTQPVSPGFPVPPVPQVVQVQVHAEKDAPPSKKKRVPKETAIQIQQVVPVEQVSQIQSTEVVLPTLSVGEEQHVVAAGPSKTEDSVLKELTRDTVTQRDIERKASLEVLKKVKSFSNKVFITRRTRHFIHINRCNEIEGFVNKYCGLVANNKNQGKSSLEALIMSDDDATSEQILQPSLLRSTSVESLRRLTSISHRSTLEKDVLRGQDSLVEGTRMSEPDFLERPRSSVMELQVSVPPETPMPMEIEHVIETREPSTLPQILEMPSEHILPAIEEIKTTELEQVSSPIDARPTEFPIHLTPRKRTPDTIDYKQRQQKIIDIVCNWNVDSQILTIEEVAEKPISRLTIARAFHDLLVLAASKYVSLYTAEDSIELKGIEKGTKLL